MAVLAGMLGSGLLVLFHETVSSAKAKKPCPFQYNNDY